jgi:hypothetical protein
VEAAEVAALAAHQAAAALRLDLQQEPVDRLPDQGHQDRTIQAVPYPGFLRHRQPIMPRPGARQALILQILRMHGGAGIPRIELFRPPEIPRTWPLWIVERLRL